MKKQLYKLITGALIGATLLMNTNIYANDKYSSEEYSSRIIDMPALIITVNNSSQKELESILDQELIKSKKELAEIKEKTSKNKYAEPSENNNYEYSELLVEKTKYVETTTTKTIDNIAEIVQSTANKEESKRRSREILYEKCVHYNPLQESIIIDPFDIAINKTERGRTKRINEMYIKLMKKQLERCKSESCKIY